MITPFTASGALDLDGAQRLAERLVAGGCDGLVLNGTTGESPTTTDAEKAALVRAVREAVGKRASIVTGAGTAGTRHTVELALEAEKAGADGVRVVTPYCSRPPQDAVEEHFRTVADACGLPVTLYDIPGRTGTRIEPETMLRLAGHPRIVAVKDCFLRLPRRPGGPGPYRAGVLRGLRRARPRPVRGGRRGLCEHGREPRPGPHPLRPGRVRRR
ncbi:dihydrodipicolinate synthase [Streptomyces sp. F-3]|uniref:4-hydroxy-tetrahydrodipicolinate synthase n=1 Tax=Streptomyces thermogriseus TaxID=75292 RepID=A0ABN1SSQ2_9ACTN|nr:dihydrodipicolinate synthase [Streptomyces sp. F-3]